ncbi:hypothetical protein TNCV_4484011 [Trichonephila clavipes]|nr:hypothetical protein TNCV_4484011 [Trichonephila clavipes]
MTCCAVLLEPQLLDIMIVQFRNEKVSNHGSIPITIDCNVVAFIVFEEGFHQPIKPTKQNFAESHDALHQKFKMAAVVECSRWSTEDSKNLLVQRSTNKLMELSEIQ